MNASKLSTIIKKTNRVGTMMSPPQLISIPTLTFALLAVLSHVYQTEAIPNSIVPVESDYANEFEDINPFQDAENDVTVRYLSDAPEVRKRFFGNQGLHYPTLYRSGRIPIRISKKALSLFTRWRGGTPYTSGAGVQDAGASNAFGARDIVSAVSRGGSSASGRPSGQPLRWGK